MQVETVKPKQSRPKAPLGWIGMVDQSGTMASARRSTDRDERSMAYWTGSGAVARRSSADDLSSFSLTYLFKCL
ncbi:hypothetical protein AAC387_Pa09g0214 [Persea americana]